MKKLKEILGGLIITTLLILILVTYLICYNLNTSKDTTLDNKYESIIYIQEDNTIKKTNFNSDNLYKDKFVGKYSCISDTCDIYENDVINPIYDDRYILILEDNKIYIYDFIDDIKSDGYDSILKLLNSNLVVSINGKMLLVDLSGNKLTGLYDRIEGSYNNLVKVVNNELYGIYDIRKDKEIINTIYPYIDITDNNYFTIKEDDLYYIIDSENNIVSDKYSYVFAFNKGYIAIVDNKLKILDYTSSLPLNTKEIDITSSFEISRESNLITINADTEYIYDINRNDFR